MAKIGYTVPDQRNFLNQNLQINKSVSYVLDLMMSPNADSKLF
jgi:hypothetical protein